MIEPDGPSISDSVSGTGSTQTALALQMNDPWFWHKLVPGLTLRERRPQLAADPIDALPVDRAIDRLAGDGFATVRAGMVPRPALLDGIRRILASGLPPVFIFMYDEPWHHLGRLRRLFEALIGGSYLYNSGIWTWHVDVGPAYAGWVPHRDYPKHPAVDSNGRPWGLSVWIPLTPTDPDNGCMYVLPARYARGEIHSSNVRDAHALPANPGDVLVWRHDVWHWGGRSSEYAENPRTSIGVELIRPGSPIDATPALDPAEIPEFRKRLALCGANLLRFDRTSSWVVLGNCLSALDTDVAAGRRA
jgi:hypothetical protein